MPKLCPTGQSDQLVSHSRLLLIALVMQNAQEVRIAEYPVILIVDRHLRTAVLRQHHTVAYFHADRQRLALLRKQAIRSDHKLLLRLRGFLKSDQRFNFTLLTTNRQITDCSIVNSNI